MYAACICHEYRANGGDAGLYNFLCHGFYLQVYDYGGEHHTGGARYRLASLGGRGKYAGRVQPPRVWPSAQRGIYPAHDTYDEMMARPRNPLENRTQLTDTLRALLEEITRAPTAQEGPGPAQSHYAGGNPYLPTNPPWQQPSARALAPLERADAEDAGANRGAEGSSRRRSRR